MSDERLRAALGAALGRPVGAVVRRPWAYASSVAMEELEVAGCPPLLLKDLSARERASRPSFLVDPAREVEAYRSLLDGAGAPACLAAVCRGDEAWVVLERLDAVPLWQAEDPGAWEAAARWLARLHARPVPAARHGLDQDPAHLRRWAQRAAAAHPVQLAGVTGVAERAIARLAAWPTCFLHGEPYPSNLLVEPGPDGPRIRPVDWETCGRGPAALDLAALLAGDWDPAARLRVLDAYRAESGARAAELGAALDAASLLVALQWLGWSAAWTAPPEHRHDWLADVARLAGRVAA